MEMKGRLRLDKLQQYIESYMEESSGGGSKDQLSSDPPSSLPEVPPDHHISPPYSSSALDLLETDYPGVMSHSSRTSLCSSANLGPLYFDSPKTAPGSPRERLQEEIQTAVPLSRIIATALSMPDPVQPNSAGGCFHRRLSAPSERSSSSAVHQPTWTTPRDHADCRVQVETLPPAASLSSSGQTSGQSVIEHPPIPSPPTLLDCQVDPQPVPGKEVPQRNKRRRPLVNRSAVNFSDGDASAAGAHGAHIDQFASEISFALERRHCAGVPLIPLEELMHIETLGSGRISTIYRAVWQPRLLTGSAALARSYDSCIGEDGMAIMVALKVATVDVRNMSKIEELRREADIASMLEHNNICSLVGIATNNE